MRKDTSTRADKQRINYFYPVRRTIIIYGLILAVLTGLLRLLDYQYMVNDLPTEIYLGIIALFFTILGIWAGTKNHCKKDSDKRSRSDGYPSLDIHVERKHHAEARHQPAGI